MVSCLNYSSHEFIYYIFHIFIGMFESSDGISKRNLEDPLCWLWLSYKAH